MQFINFRIYGAHNKYKGMRLIKIPTHATLLLGKNEKYIVEKLHLDTKQVTLREEQKVYNTVSVKNVIFDFSNFTDVEIKELRRALNI